VLGIQLDMVDWVPHLRTTGTALKRWFVAQCLDALCVSFLWLVGLLIIGIPWAPLWAVLAGLLQFIPNFGAVLAVAPPALIGAFSSDYMRLFYVLMLFAVIMMVDGFVLQPYLMRRTAKVPFWAALLAPLVLGFVIPFWGVLLAPPLLAIIYTFRNRQKKPLPTSAPTDM
jgi:predicted PurR-regulated permease PerM